MQYALIMAGGSGTRLWPMSTADRPKQLIPFLNGRSLLQVAFDRLDGLIEPAHRYICTGESFRAPIRTAMPQIGDQQILGEPEGRDTLAAVGLPAAVLQKQDPDAVIAVFTADHLIEPVEKFANCVRTGFDVVAENPNTLVTFGIEPTYAATGFGYVKLGDPIEGHQNAFATAEFREKPDAQTAEQYVQSGAYRWNSGMFIWRADTLLDRIARYEPQVHAGLMQIAEAWGTDRQSQVLEQVYPTLKKISVDYAVMENASRDEAVNLATVSMPVQWQDIGSWPAFGQTCAPDDAGNRIAAKHTVLQDSSQNIVVSEEDDHLIATLGVEGLIIVKTENATLICRADAAEDIKALHAQVKEQYGDRFV